MRRLCASFTGTSLQLESLFTICFFLQSPENVQLYLKNAWRKTFIRLLLHQVEYAHLERFDEYNNRFGLEILDKLQAVSYETNEERRTSQIEKFYQEHVLEPPIIYSALS